MLGPVWATPPSGRGALLPDRDPGSREHTLTPHFQKVTRPLSGSPQSPSRCARASHARSDPADAKSPSSRPGRGWGSHVHSDPGAPSIPAPGRPSRSHRGDPRSPGPRSRPGSDGRTDPATHGHDARTWGHLAQPAGSRPAPPRPPSGRRLRCGPAGVGRSRVGRSGQRTAAAGRTSPVPARSANPNPNPAAGGADGLLGAAPLPPPPGNAGTSRGRAGDSGREQTPRACGRAGRSSPPPAGLAAAFPRCPAGQSADGPAPASLPTREDVRASAEAASSLASIMHTDLSESPAQPA